MGICPSIRTTRRSGKASSKIAQDAAVDRLYKVKRKVITISYFEEFQGTVRRLLCYDLACGRFPFHVVSSNQRFAKRYK
jgi:hypothetical protein